MTYTIEELKHDVHYLLEELDVSTSTSDEVFLDNSEVGILRHYIEYLENKLK